jgi:acetoin utilization deacetylase AcuC-like enzyme
MNIPLTSIDDINDQDYMNVITELILPIVKQYQPELILVCVDFHIQNLTALCYGWIIEQLTTINNSKLVVALDGDLSDISSKTSYVQTVLSVLIGKLSSINHDQWKMDTINMDTRQKIDLIKGKHKQYWSCFQ